MSTKFIGVIWRFECNELLCRENMRKKLKPDQNLKSIQKELLEEISDEYKRFGTLSGTARAMGISLMKVRKALITSGDFSSEISEEVERMIEDGKSVEYIARTLNLTESSVYSYIPYKIRAYNLSEKSVDAEVLRYRERTRAVDNLKNCVSGEADWKDELWKCIELYEGQKFRTSGRGKDHAGAVGFSYHLKVSSRTGEKTDEMIISSREAGKTITRSSVELAFKNAMDEQGSVGYVSGPKKLGGFGSSYLYAIFLKWGVIKAQYD